MKTLAKEVLRWAAIVVYGGYGVWGIIEAGYEVTHGDWFDLVSPLTCLSLHYALASPPFACVGGIASFFSFSAC
jgi:hypothetical protein